MSDFKTLRFTAGFTYRGLRFAFYNKELYRLPYTNGQRQYPARILPVIKVGNALGYRCALEKLSGNKITALLKPVDWKITLMTNANIMPKVVSKEVVRYTSIQPPYLQRTT